MLFAVPYISCSCRWWSGLFHAMLQETSETRHNQSEGRGRDACTSLLLLQCVNVIRNGGGAGGLHFFFNPSSGRDKYEAVNFKNNQSKTASN